MLYKGELEGFPVEVVELMLQRQEEQGNLRNVLIFENKVDAWRGVGGFVWGKTSENWDFWNSVINDKKFDVFFEKYPKDKEENNMLYKGELEGFPVEVVELMLQRQEEQGNPRNIEIFEENSDAWIHDGGFAWNETSENWDFWNSVINDKKFDVFFEKYPKDKLEGFLVEEEQGNPRNIEIFEKDLEASRNDGGFAWGRTSEDGYIWGSVLENTEIVSELPKVMLVSDNDEDWYKRVVVAFKKVATTLDEAADTLEILSCKFAKELPKLKLTRENLLTAFPDLDLENFEEE